MGPVGAAGPPGRVVNAAHVQLLTVGEQRYDDDGAQDTFATVRWSLECSSAHERHRPPQLARDHMSVRLQRAGTYLVRYALHVETRAPGAVCVRLAQPALLSDAWLAQQTSAREHCFAHGDCGPRWLHGDEVVLAERDDSLLALQLSGAARLYAHASDSIAATCVVLQLAEADADECVSVQ